ncbi:MAG: V-type ATP synthase subunit E [Methermicoccaceae archaeon]
MGLEELKERIQREASEELERYRKQVEAERARIIEEWRIETEKKAEAILREGKKEAQFAKRRELSATKLRVRMEKANAIASLINEVYEETAKHVLSLPDEEKKKLLQRMMEDASAGLDSYEVFVDRQYASLLPDAKPDDIGEFGVVVVSGKLRIERLLSDRLQELKSLRPEVHKILFGVEST